jgi:hypothetical protein
MSSAFSQIPNNNSHNMNLYQNTNENTKNLKIKLNEIGKTEKTVFNRLKNLTPGSKSQTFLNKITEIIEKIDPKKTDEYKPLNHKKIIEILVLLTEFKKKKQNFQDLIRQANQIEANIKKMINIFESKEAINNVHLDTDIKQALMGQTKFDEIIRNKTKTKQQIDANISTKITSLYKQFIDAYIKNYELAIKSANNSIKKNSMKQIDLLNIVHHLFYVYYPDFINKKDDELVKKLSEINILKKYIELNDYVQPNKSKPIIDITNKSQLSQLSQVFMDLANQIYELAFKTEDVNKFKLLKDMLYDLYDKYSAIFIEPQINRTAEQTIGNFTGPYKNQYNSIKNKYRNLNNKYKKLGTNMSNFKTSGPRINNKKLLMNSNLLNA